MFTPPALGDDVGGVAERVAASLAP